MTKHSQSVIGFAFLFLFVFILLMTTTSNTMTRAQKENNYITAPIFALIGIVFLICSTRKRPVAPQHR